eukprot:g3121.t1
MWKTWLSRDSSSVISSVVCFELPQLELAAASMKFGLGLVFGKVDVAGPAKLDTGVNVIENDHAMKFILEKICYPTPYLLKLPALDQAQCIGNSPRILHATMDCTFDTHMTSIGKINIVLSDKIQEAMQKVQDSCTTCSIVEKAHAEKAHAEGHKAHSKGNSEIGCETVTEQGDRIVEGKKIKEKKRRQNANIKRKKDDGLLEKSGRKYKKSVLEDACGLDASIYFDIQGGA